MSCCSSSKRLTTCDKGSAFRVPSASRSAKFSIMDCAGKRSSGIWVPYFFLSVGSCDRVGLQLSFLHNFDVFHAVTTRANSRLCGHPPDVKSNPRSDAQSLSAVSESNMSTKVSRSEMALTRSVLMTLSCVVLFRKRCSNAGSN